MTTGVPFSPTPFATSVVSPSVSSAYQRQSYITPSEFRFSPTAVSTRSLVAKSPNQSVDTTGALAQVISRASGWADLICFHRADGGFGASITTESDWVKAKPDGSAALICNFKPVREVTGLALGPLPGHVDNVSSSVAQSIWIESEKVIWVPACWNTGPVPVFFSPTGPGGSLFAIWTYVNGFPNTTLAENCAAGAQTLTVNPSVPGGSSVCGVYANSPLQIVDGSKTETVVVSEAPTGTTLNLTAGLQYSHTVPLAPDGIRVSAIPWAVEQAVIYLTSVLIKTQGTRAMTMPQTGGGSPSTQVMAEAGAMGDYRNARKLLDPFVTTYLH